MMPIIRKEPYEGMDEEDLDEEEMEELKRAEKRASRAPAPARRIRPKPKPAEPTPPPMRYSAFSIPPRAGIIDTETNEVIAEGELALLQILADVKTQLERIETAIGNLMGE